MNSFSHLLILLIFYKVEGRYKDRLCSDPEQKHENGNSILVKCEKTLICNEEPLVKPGLFCLPWQYFNKDNGTWLEVDSNSTVLCNPISCIPDKSRNICNNLHVSNPTYSTIDIIFNWLYFRLNILVFVLINDNCSIGAMCTNCSLIKNMIKIRFAECQPLNTTTNYHKFTINNLKENQLFEFYFIQVLNETSITSVEKLLLKTRKKSDTVKNVKVTWVGSTDMEVQWEGDTEVDRYCFIGLDRNFHDVQIYKNTTRLFHLKPCQEFCFKIEALNSKGEQIGISEKKCSLTKPDFNEIELLPIKSDLLTYKQIQWKYHKISDYCKIEFTVEYGTNQTLFRMNTTSNSLNLTNLEINQIYSVKVFPVSGNEKGPHFAKKQFLTMKINNLIEDYIETDEYMANIFKNSWIYSIEHPDLNTKYELLNFPLFIEQSENNPMKQIKKNTEKISKRIGIRFKRQKNGIKVSLDILENDYEKTIEFILTLMNQPNKCILITDCKDCNNNHRDRTINAVTKMQSKGVIFCKMDQHSNGLKDKKENSDFSSKITIKFNKIEKVIFIYSIDLSDRKAYPEETLWFLGLIIILLLIILILFSDKMGLISIGEIMTVISGRKRFRNYIREICTGKSVPVVNRTSSENNNIMMNIPMSLDDSSKKNFKVIQNFSRRNSIKIRNSEIIDPNHPHFQIILEYGKICKQAQIREKLNFTFKIANLPENVKKNRFKNILPFDQARVALQSQNFNTDYINASLIPFTDDPTATEYIAAQGPLANTITDFWYMIWEQNVSVIVMLTKVYEGLNLKCEQYWSTSINKEYIFDENLSLSVVLEEEIYYGSFIERIFKLVNKNLDQVRKVTQIHMQKWNDFSKPKKHDFQECITRFHEITPRNSAPYLIHCSAGVGRTGTFIAIDRLIKKNLKENLNLKIKDVVLDLRIFRHNMVQQDSQYIFIHEFIDFFSRKFKMQSVHCQSDEVCEEISNKKI